jgi:drug/metabolite transporter (DMT)-like permease
MSRSDLAIFAFLGAVWGGAFLFLRISSPQVGPVWAAEARIGLAAVVLLVLFGPRSYRALKGRFLKAAVVGVTFSAIPFSLIAIASLTLPVGFTALLNAATPIFTALVSAAWIGQRLTTRTLVGMGIGAMAVLVIVGWSPLPLGPGTLLAVAAGLGAPLSYAVAGTFVRRHLSDVGGTELATAQLTTGAIVLLPIAVLSGAPGVPGVDGIAALIAIAVLSTAIAWPLFFRVLKHTTPMAASTVTFIVPAFGMAWGAIALGEPVGPELVIGFAMVVVSLALVLGMPLAAVATVRARAASLFGRLVAPRPTAA